MEKISLDKTNFPHLSREELESKCVKMANHLAEGVVLMDGAMQKIEWLANTCRLLASSLVELHPELKEPLDELLKKVDLAAG